MEVPRFKNAEYRAETEADIQLAAQFLGVAAAEALREGAGIGALDRDGAFAHVHGCNGRFLAGAEAESLPAIAPRHKNAGEQDCHDQQRNDNCFDEFHNVSFSWKL